MQTDDPNERRAKMATELVRFDPCPGDGFRPNSTPIYQTATFEQPSATEFGPYDYSRSANPTRSVLEKQVARLEGARHAFSFASGMAALATLFRLVARGSHVVAGDDLYGGTYRLLSRVLPDQGIDVSHADTTNLDDVARALTPETRLLLIESPTNPLLRISDIAALAELAHENGTLLVVDNSVLSPYLQSPIALGADVVIESATKYLSGHGDVTAGVLAVNDDAIAEQIGFHQNATGVGLGPFDSWLLLRGMKTLALRMDRQNKSAHQIVSFLQAQPLVKQVHYPGLTDHPGHDLHQRQARGAGGVFSFETGSVEASRCIVEATRLFTISVSFGSVSSLISLPCRMSHASIPESVRRARALPEDLVRISVGIEDADDLIEDLNQALTLARDNGAVAPAKSQRPWP